MMDQNSVVPNESTYGRLSSAAAIAAMLTGGAVMAAWALQVEIVKSVLPGLAVMKFNAALCFVLAGVSLYCRGPRSSSRARLWGTMAAGVALAVALATLYQYAFNKNLGIDELVFQDYSTVVPASPPGRMAIGTALGFVMISAALLVLDLEPRQGWAPSEWLGLLGALTGAAALLAYAFGIHQFQFRYYATIGLHTATLLLVLGLGILAARPRRGLISVISSDRLGGKIARMVLPSVILVQVALGWLSVQGVKAGVYGTMFGFALECLTSIVVLSGLIWAGARRINRSEAGFRAVVEAAPSGLVMVDREGRVVLANSRMEKLFGYPRDALIGQKVEMLVPAWLRADHRRLRAEYLRHPVPYSLGAGRELYGLRRDGSTFPIEIGLNPVEAPGRTFVLADIADITARKQAEQELRSRTEELARSNRDLEQFAYVASHDLQEPLRGISGCVQLLQKRYAGRLDSRADELIEHAVDGAARMHSLIDGLLSYSRVGRTEVSTQAVDSGEALDLALKNLTETSREVGAEITRGNLPEVQGVPDQLALLFQNLMANALKFRRKDAPVRVHVEANPDKDGWLFQVRDNGIGIESRYYDRIFVVFQRLHTRREYPGTGLGLALCKRIVEHHGGRIWLESEPGVGTTFFFTLPGGAPPRRNP